jgi:hypothetical protein
VSPLTLQRIPYQPGHATFGELYSEQGRRECVTLELPWKDNARNVSCIPAGEYTAERYFSPHHGCTVFKLIDVPDRDDVELHIGNTVNDSKGCILLGLDFGTVKDQAGITGSKAAFLSFMADHPEQRFSLTVIDPLPEHHV